MSRPTGPGRYQEYRDPRCFLLYNFDIDGDALKAEHEAYVRSTVVPILRSGSSVGLTGLASRTADNSHNLALSQRRVEHATEFLRTVLPAGVTITGAGGLGEIPAAAFGVPDSTEDERFRAVVMFVSIATPSLPPTPPVPDPPVAPTLPVPPRRRQEVIPRPHIRPTPVPTTGRTSHFRVRIIGGMGVSLGVGVEAMTLDIWDFENNLLCTYELRGVSLGAGTPLAVSLRGPWNDFSTPEPMTCSDFGGIARFGTVFVMDKSVNVLTLEPVGSLPVEVVPFRTGWTLGFGISGGGGVLTRSFPPIPADEAWWPHNVE